MQARRRGDTTRVPIQAVNLEPSRTFNAKNSAICYYLDPTTKVIRGLDPSTVKSDNQLNASIQVKNPAECKTENPDGTTTWSISTNANPIIFGVRELIRITRSEDCYTATMRKQSDDDKEILDVIADAQSSSFTSKKLVVAGMLVILVIIMALLIYSLK